jgi:hypothetical protein
MSHRLCNHFHFLSTAYPPSEQKNKITIMLTSSASFGFLLLLTPSWMSMTMTTTMAQTPTVEPTAGPNDCDRMNSGDIYFTYVQSLQPDELVLFPFEDIPGDMQLYLTDNAWTGTGFQSDEGTLEVSPIIIIEWWSKYVGTRTAGQRSRTVLNMRMLCCFVILCVSSPSSRTIS